MCMIECCLIKRGHQQLREIGLVVDAPVSGGEPGAIAGTLAIMAGGDAKDFEVLQKYFAILGSTALLIGGSGSGSVTRLVTRLL